MINRLLIYWQVWKMTASNALQEAFINRWTNLIFISGKIIRFGMSLVFLLLLKQNVTVFANYTVDQMIVFFLTYNLIDIIAQVFYRGVYLFSPMVRTGEFDFLLAKPISALFRALTGKPDINDTVFLLPTLLVSWLIIRNLSVTISLTSIAWFIVLLINSFLIVTALHILVLVVGILTTEVDGVIWMYRDLMRLGQFPASVYLEPLRFILYFVVPIGMMITVPAEVLLNVPPSTSILTTSLVGLTSFVVSLRLWNWSLKRYSSASS